MNRSFPKAEQESINAKTFGDLLYLAHTQNFRVYLYEIQGDIAGVVAFKLLSNRSLFIDLVVRDVNYKEAKVGGMLMRWAENFARHSNCLAISLMAVGGAVEAYKKYEYEPNHEMAIDVGGGEINIPMSKKILYNVKWNRQLQEDANL